MNRAAAQDPEQVVPFLMVHLLKMFDLGLFSIKNGTFFGYLILHIRLGFVTGMFLLSANMSMICMLFLLAMSGPLCFPLTSQSILILV